MLKKRRMEFIYWLKTVMMFAIINLIRTTTKLIYVRYNIKKGNLYAKFKNAFGNPDIRNDISFWYGHIGAQHITLASSGADQWSYWEYEFIVSD